jgi:hypothetical protein
MGCAAGGPSVRACDIEFPTLNGLPTFPIISATVSCVPPEDGRKPDLFVIIGMTFHREAGYLGCSIAAQNVLGDVGSECDFVCNYTK